MIRLLSKKAGFILAVAGAAVVGGATTALVTAAIPSSTDGQIHACYRNGANLTNAKGALRVVDSEAGQTCTAQESALDWNQSSVSVRGYAYVVYDQQTGMYSVDASRSKNISLVNPAHNAACLKFEGTPKSVSLTAGDAGSTLAYAAVKDANGWTNAYPAGDGECDTAAAGSNIFVSVTSSFFVQVY